MNILGGAIPWLRLLGVSVLLSGCTLVSVGPVVESFPPWSGRGVEARITTAEVSVKGELLNVTDSGLIIAAYHRAGVAMPDTILYSVEWPALRTAEFEHIDIRLTGGIPGPETQLRLSSVARYPAVLSPHQVAAVLQKYRQATLEVARD
jgi:hypothetical protein